MKHGLWKVTFRWKSPVSLNIIEDVVYVAAEYDEKGRTPQSVLSYISSTLESLGGGSHDHSYVGVVAIL